jgi:uncharacterized protein YcbX
MHLSELNIYPIKSCRGISLAEAVVEERGLQFDRRWMLVDENNRFLTQREYPRMATIRASVDNGQLTVNNGRNSIEIDPAKTQSRKERVTVWNSEVEATVYESEVNEFFSDILGASVRLAHMTDEDRRAVNPRFDRGHDIVSFADGYPLMALGEATAGDLNRRLAENNNHDGAGETPAFQSLPMNRFRPNFVISGSEAYAEDDWLRIRVGEVAFRSTKPCERCVITTVDQARGEFDGKDPLKTLATYRLAKDVMPDRIEALGVSPNGVLFGQNLIAETAGAMIKVGDEVEVIESY